MLLHPGPGVSDGLVGTEETVATLQVFRSPRLMVQIQGSLAMVCGYSQSAWPSSVSGIFCPN